MADEPRIEATPNVTRLSGMPKDHPEYEAAYRALCVAIMTFWMRVGLRG